MSTTERNVGTISRGIRCPIIREGDDIGKIVVDSVLKAGETDNFEVRDRDIICVTESVVARAQGNYASVDESIEHHSRLLMGDRYKRCHRYDSTDYHNWLVAIKACGYATAPDYVKKLEGMIKRYKLYLFDRIALKA